MSQRETAREVGQLEPRSWGGHPLFPRAATETGPDRRRFDLIRIMRHKPDGTKELCPKAWKGSELRSWAQIVEAYGGGVYQLSAQCAHTHRYQAHTGKMPFDGPSKSFVDLPKVSPAETRAAPPPSTHPLASRAAFCPAA
jgi:hypothetical protein